MDLGLANRIALVTASSRGLGRAIAAALSREGAKVVMCARDESRLAEARAAIARETGGEVRAFRADVTAGEDVRELVRSTAATFGSLDILVCNAGGPPAGFFEDFGPDDYRKAIDLNLMSTVRLCYEAAPWMKKGNWGRIIALTSVAAKQPIDNLILSNTARAGVLGFVKSLAARLAGHGITVNALCPGYTRTERVEGLAKAFAEKGLGTVEDYYGRVEKAIPAGRLGRPEEVAAAAAFLASEAAAYITGAALQVDGGYVKGLI
ncbi:MAG: SDR family oxidoreductase [Candidatus Aminicenantes bacterium]|nr:SDR family oxidoreductase [Candidatus Aminicenantes bacterium]